MRRVLFTAVLCLALVLFGAAHAFAAEPNDSFPGVPMGISGVSGVIDYNTDRTDIYAVTLFEGQSVTFTVRRTDTADESKFWFVELYGPDATSLAQQSLASRYGQYMSTGEQVSVSYTPARTGVYYLSMQTLDDIFSSPAYGLGYAISVSGSASMPSSATRWSAKVAPGYGLTPNYGSGTTLRGVLMPTFRAIGIPFTNAVIQRSTDLATWTTVGTVPMPSGIGYYSTPGLQVRAFYRFRFSGASAWGASNSAYIMVKPKAYVSVPVTPATVYVNKTFVTYGYLKPRHIAGTLPAKMRFYRWGRNASGVNAWVLKKTVDAKAYDYSTYSKCCSWTSLPSTGSWKVELYHATDAGNNAAVSESRYFSVK